jgi:Stress responsive A/B Barrel Domain
MGGETLQHIVMFGVSPDAPREAVERIITEAREMLTQIPGVSNLRAGHVIQKDSPYQIVLSMELPDEATLAAYRVHPLHVKYITEVLEPVRMTRFAVDFLG